MFGDAQWPEPAVARHGRDAFGYPQKRRPGAFYGLWGTSGLLSVRAITGVLTPVIVDVAMNAWPTSGSFEDLEGFVEFSAPIGFSVAAVALSKINVQGTLGRVLVDVP